MQKSVGFILLIICYSLAPKVIAATETNHKNGTGWVVAPKLIATNNHVVSGYKQAVIVLPDQSEATARVIASDVVNDLALLRVVDEITLPAAIPIAKQYPAVGEQVFTIGYPHPEYMGTDPKLSVGIINAQTGMANDPRIFQISVPLQSGNSGGPLLNMSGEAVGIVTSKLNAMKMFKWTGDVPQNVNYAMKIDYLKTLVNLNVTNGLNSYDVLASDKNTLVNLTRRVRHSIVLIKAGIVAAQTINKAKAQENVIRHNKKESEVTNKSKPEAPKNKSKRTLAIYTHMRMGDYDNLGLTGLSSTEDYSKYTTKIAKDISEANKTQQFNVIKESFGATAERYYYRVHSASRGQRLCQRLGADFILAIKNDFEIISYWHEEFNVVIRDCTTNTDFSRGYYIEPHIKDKFIYERSIRQNLANFINEFTQ